VGLQAPTIPGATYVWSLDGQVLPNFLTSTLLDTRAGIYSVSITTPGGCVGSDAIDVTSIIAPTPLFETTAGLPTSVSASNPTVTFVNLSANATRFEWDFGDSTALDSSIAPTHIYPLKPNQYFVTLYAYNGNCVDSVKLGPITIANVDDVFIPNAFSPNNDGLNDIFEFPSLGLQTYNLRIYNRWGNLVFDNNGNVTNFWNGKMKNEDQRECPEGAYFYKLEITKDDGTKKNLDGSVMLVR
jgi:gliding motility-associated-like protein